MQKVYDEIIEFVLSSGKRIKDKAGKIDDIGVKKKYLTEEDIIIERGLKDIVTRYDKNHTFYAEEEHDSFPDNEDIWVADPISGTKTFIEGLPHYAIVVCYLKKGVPQFSVVYDPSVNELFTAYIGKGAFLNDKPICVSNNKEKIIIMISYIWDFEYKSKDLLRKFEGFDVSFNKNSFAVNYCHVACGRYDGSISFTKDSFPEFAGSLMIKEAGGVFRNDNNEDLIHHLDRTFVGGNEKTYAIIKTKMLK